MKYKKSYAVYAETVAQAMELTEAQKLLDKQARPLAVPNSYYRFSPSMTPCYTGQQAVPYNVRENPQLYYQVEANITFKEWQDMLNEDKVVTSYKLLHDTPELKAGDVFKKSSLADTYYCLQRKAYYSAKVVENNPNWFEPMYTPLAKVLQCAPTRGGEPFEFEVTNESVKAIRTGQPDLAIDVKDLQALIDTMKHFRKFNSFIVGFPMVDVGCKKGIPLNELESVLETYNSLQ